jgi:undecaprenyl-phosphate 4-deoxy-4-formamido-L-arabinose transferase
MQVSVVVPVFGDGGDLVDLSRRVGSVLGAIGGGWELILINDGSPAATWEIVRALASTSPNIKGINLRRNFGQQNALVAGIRAASGEIIVTLDDDLQHPPEEIPVLLSRLQGADVVYGTPSDRVRGAGRHLVSALSKRVLATVLGATHARSIGAFRAFRGPLRAIFEHYNGPYVSVDVLLSWSTTRIAAVPVRYEPRRRGRSGYRWSPLFTLTINMVTGFSVWPLRVASVIGIVFAGFGVSVLAFVLVRYVTSGATVPGFAFLACIIAIFSGAQLFSLGIIGEYLARMYFRTLDKPAYVIESTVNLPGERTA